MTRVEFYIPWPPSLNHAYGTGANGRRFYHKPGKRFVKAVGENVLVQRVPRHLLSGRLRVDLLLQAPDRRAYDIDNRVKASLDSLQKNGVIATDAAVDELHVSRGEPFAPTGQVRVTIEELRA